MKLKVVEKLNLNEFFVNSREQDAEIRKKIQGLIEKIEGNILDNYKFQKQGNTGFYILPKNKKAIYNLKFELKAEDSGFTGSVNLLDNTGTKVLCENISNLDIDSNGVTEGTDSIIQTITSKINPYLNLRLYTDKLIESYNLSEAGIFSKIAAKIANKVSNVASGIKGTVQNIGDNIATNEKNKRGLNQVATAINNILEKLGKTDNFKAFNFSKADSGNIKASEDVYEAIIPIQGTLQIILGVNLAPEVDSDKIKVVEVLDGSNEKVKPSAKSAYKVFTNLGKVLQKPLLTNQDLQLFNLSNTQNRGSDGKFSASDSSTVASGTKEETGENITDKIQDATIKSLVSELSSNDLKDRATKIFGEDLTQRRFRKPIREFIEIIEDDESTQNNQDQQSLDNQKQIGTADPLLSQNKQANFLDLVKQPTQDKDKVNIIKLALNQHFGKDFKLDDATYIDIYNLIKKDGLTSKNTLLNLILKYIETNKNENPGFNGTAYLFLKGIYDKHSYGDLTPDNQISQELYNYIFSKDRTTPGSSKESINHVDSLFSLNDTTSNSKIASKLNSNSLNDIDNTVKNVVNVLKNGDITGFPKLMNLIKSEFKNLNPNTDADKNKIDKLYDTLIQGIGTYITTDNSKINIPKLPN